MGVDGKALTTFLIETVITAGVPTVFALIVVAFAAKAFSANKKDDRDSGWGQG